MRHPHYSGSKAEHVASVGSRLPGVVKPGWGRPKLTAETNPLKMSRANGLSGHHGMTSNVLGPADIDAKSSYRRTFATKKLMAEKRTRVGLDRHAHRSNDRHVAAGPRLVKIA